MLEPCYRESLLLATSNNFRKIGFPIIGSGCHGFPVGLAVEAAVRTVSSFLEFDDSIERVILIYNDDEITPVIEQEMAHYKVDPDSVC